MDEAFIRQAFEFHDERIVSVKIIRNKATGQTLGYGFVEFKDGVAARDAMLKLNGKPIPGVAVSHAFFVHLILFLRISF